MFAVFASDPSLRARVRALLPPDPPPSTTGNWLRFQLLLPDSGCSCAVVPRLSSSWIWRLDGSARAVDILVTGRDSENARRLKDVRIAEVVWLEALGRELPVAGRRVAARTRRSRIGDVLERVGLSDPTLLRALEHALDDPDPPVSVSGLARRVGWDRRTLAVHWRRAAGDGAIRLTETIQWIVLLRAVEKKVQGRSWQEVAGSLDVTGRTLFRISRRLTGASAGEVARVGVPRLRAWVRSILEGALRSGEGSAGGHRPTVGDRDTLSLVRRAGDGS